MKPDRLARLAVLLCVVLLAGCSRHDIYQWLIERERDSAGLVSAEVDVAGLSVSYLANEPAAAPARTLLMVHGFGANKDNWVRLVANLPEGYRVLIPDLPGHGDSSEAGDYTIEAQAAVLSGFLDQLGVDRVDMAGNSMGGGITAYFAAYYPDRVRTIALFDPAGSDRYPSQLDAELARGHNPLVVREPGDFEQLMDFVLEQPPFLPWPVVSVLEEQAIARQQINDRIFQAILSSAGQLELETVLQRIQAPALIVWGRADRVLAPENARVFASGLSQSRLVLLDGVGHVPMLEVPRQSASLWDEFLSAHPSPSHVGAAAQVND